MFVSPRYVSLKNAGGCALRGYSDRERLIAPSTPSKCIARGALNPRIASASDLSATLDFKHLEPIRPESN